MQIIKLTSNRVLIELTDNEIALIATSVNDYSHYRLITTENTKPLITDTDHEQEHLIVVAMIHDSLNNEEFYDLMLGNTEIPIDNILPN